MPKKSIATTENPFVTINAFGPLTIKGWDRAEVKIEAKKDDCLQLEATEEQVSLHCSCACHVSVPHSASINLQKAYGSTIISDVFGTVEIGTISGKLVVHDVGPLVIAQASGSLTAKNVNGELTIKNASSSVSVINISGDVVIEHAGGHLTVNDILGDITAEVSGNVNLSQNPLPGNSYEIKAYGLLNAHFPEAVDAEINLTAHGPATIAIGDVQKSLIGGEFNHTFGEGSAKITFTVSGPANLLSGKRKTKATDDDDIHIDLGINEDFDEQFGEQFAHLADDISLHIHETINAQMEALDLELEHLTHQAESLGVSKDRAEEWSQRAQEKAERARIKIQKAAEKAQARTARKIAAAQRRAEAKARKAAQRKPPARERQWTLKGDFSGTKTDPVSEEERMLILHMLAENKINAEEADQLLAALEGK